MLPSQVTIRPVPPKRKKIVMPRMPSGIRTRRKPEPTGLFPIHVQVHMTLSDRPRVRFDLLLLESGSLGQARLDSV